MRRRSPRGGGAGILTYRCHTGHRFGANELLVHQVSDVERAVMVAIRVLRERSALCRRMISEAEAADRTFGAAIGLASRKRPTASWACCSISSTGRRWQPPKRPRGKINPPYSTYVGDSRVGNRIRFSVPDDREGVLVATVEIHLVGSDFARVMGDMRVWLDRQKVVRMRSVSRHVSAAWRCMSSSNTASHADGFAGHFGGGFWQSTSTARRGKRRMSQYGTTNRG